MARRLIEIGYPVSRTPEGWDLHGIDRGLIEKFSRRTAEIEAECRRLGITDPAEKDGLGARTRASKDKDLGLTDLALAWQHRLTQDEAQWIHRMAQEPGIRDLRNKAVEQGKPVAESQQPLNFTPAVTAEQALDHAIRHVYARTAVESDRRLAAEVLKHAVGDVTPGQVWAALEAHPELLTRREDGERWVTTREVHAEEKRVLEFAVAGRGTCVPLGKGYGGREGNRYRIGSVADREGFQLNAPQTAAVEHLISSRDRLMLLRGGAGTGKTTLLKEARAAIEHGGTRVFACAVTTDASRGVLAEAGFRDACPVETVVTNRSLQERMAGQVIWVDEAGMVGTPTMKKLCDLADRIDARLVLSGDIKQQSGVERGDPMGLIERRAGIRPAEVNEILRQKGLYKQAVEAIQQGQLKESVQMLDELGAIREIRDLDNPERRHAELADRYVEATKGGKTAMVVSPTHAEGKQVTGLIREKLKESGAISREERTFTRLKDLQWTEAERADAHNYTPGMVVQFTQHCPGHARHGILPVAGNTRAKVLAVDADRRLIMTEDVMGHRRPLPLNLASRFQVFEEQELKLAVGDQIRITRNTHTMDPKSGTGVGRRVNNGSNYGIAGFTKDGNIRLDNKAKWTLHRNVGHITHAYCTTPQAAQGKSVNTFLAALSGSSLAASTLEQIYVMVSRGTKSCELITDSRKSLVDAMARLDHQRSATELLDESGSSPSTRQLRLLAHSREVQRMRLYEANRKRIMGDRQRSAKEQAARQQQAARGRTEQQRHAPKRQPPGREPPTRER